MLKPKLPKPAPIAKAKVAKIKSVSNARVHRSGVRIKVGK